MENFTGENLLKCPFRIIYYSATDISIMLSLNEMDSKRPPERGISSGTNIVDFLVIMITERRKRN